MAVTAGRKQQQWHWQDCSAATAKNATAKNKAAMAKSTISVCRQPRAVRLVSNGGGNTLQMHMRQIEEGSMLLVALYILPIFVIDNLI